MGPEILRVTQCEVKSQRLTLPADDANINASNDDEKYELITGHAGWAGQ